MRGRGDFGQLRRYRCVMLLSGIMVTLTLTPATNLVKGDNINPGLYSTNSAPYGIPYQQWTERLWQWDFSLPTAQHPKDNYTPEKCANGQNGPVWFLTEVLSGTQLRTCTIPAGKSILAAFLDGECDRSDPTLQMIKTCVKVPPKVTIMVLLAQPLMGLGSSIWINTE
jgi:hypothetical protein